MGEGGLPILPGVSIVYMTEIIKDYCVGAVCMSISYNLCTYMCIYIIPQTVLAQLRGSYLFFIVIPLCSRIAGGQPKYLSLKYLSPAGDSLCSRIAGGQPKYLSLKYISPAADSLCSRIAGGQPKYLSLKYLSPAADSLCSRIAGGQPKYLSLKYQTVLAQLRGSYLFPKQCLHN